MESMFDMTEVFDASELFWEFIASVLDNTYDRLICTDTFSNFARGIESMESLGLTLETILYQKDDVKLLNIDLSQHPYFDDATEYFVFRNISQLLRELEQFYHDIIRFLNPSNRSKEYFDCVQRYVFRYEMIKRCIQKIQAEVMIQESESLFDNLMI